VCSQEYASYPEPEKNKIFRVVNGHETEVSPIQLQQEAHQRCEDEMTGMLNNSKKQYKCFIECMNGRKEQVPVRQLGSWQKLRNLKQDCNIVCPASMR
jgi:hypothetical protein